MKHGYWLSLALTVLVACGGPSGRPDGDGGNGDGGTCENTCSADLHSVTDCNGNVVQECGGDQGCSGGVCVPACQAAADSRSSVGCDYYAVAPDVIDEGQGGCFAAFIANTWTAPITISVERGGVSYPVDGYARIPSGQGQGLTYAPLQNGQLGPNEVAILFLSRFGTALSDCPAGITPAITGEDPAVHGTGYGAAFHITTSAPAVAYDIYPYGGGAVAATSATLLLPSTAWDNDYVAVNAYRKSTAVPQAQPFIELVGSQDNTTVTVIPTTPIVGGPGVAPAAQGTPTTYTLQRGQVLQFTQDAELGGSTLASDKPIGVWGGATCLSIDVGAVACDSAHQQIPPVRALGHRYAAVRHRDRFPGNVETVPWRIVGAVDGTTLSYAPSAPAGAPTTLARGQVVEFATTEAFTIQSQDADHPFYLSAHMTGCGTVSGDLFDCRGDPEFVNVIPLDQFLNKYTFFTDPTYPETSLVLVREKRNGSYADVNLGCLGTVTGWQPVDASDNVQYARLDLVTGNFQGVGNCNNGLHTATSAAPFGVVVWGWGSAASSGFQSQAVSYAYPAGADIKQINDVILLKSR